MSIIKCSQDITVSVKCLLSKDGITLQHCLQVEDNLVKQVQAEKDALLAQVRGQMSDMQQQHDHMAAELQRKLAWWVMCQGTS